MNKEPVFDNNQNDQREYQYYAFISYSHKDMKWARWLQKELETYKLPSKLQENQPQGEEKKENPIQPVFRDETSINPGKTVDDALKSELEKSKYLVVICSPASSASSWVDREVERFVEMGREDCIMPFIVEGVPHSDKPEEECYPPALRALAEKKGSSILGADVQARGKREAFLCTVAFLLGIDLETLRSREAERRRKRNITIFAACAVLIALCVFAGIKAWDYYVPKVEYYQDYVMRFGLPEGLGQLTKQQAASREGYFVITRKYGKIQNIAHKNAYGKITDIPDSERWDDPAYMEFNYDDNGNLISNVRYQANGKPIMTWKYTNHLRVVQIEYPEQYSNESDEYGSSNAMTLSSNTQNMSSAAYSRQGERSLIAGYQIKYTEDGLVRDLYYCSMPAFGYRTKDENGIYGLRYDYDAEGHITRIQYLDENNELMATEKGIAQKEYAYDQFGQRIRVEYQDKAGNPAINSEGWAIDIQEFKDGNIIAEETRDEKGNLVINNQGYARLDVVVDEYGNSIEMRISDTDGKPMLDNIGWYKQTFAYDENGNEIERRGYGLDGEPALCSFGYAGYHSSYDANGNVTGETYFDKNGDITKCIYGYATVKNAYNDRNEVIEESYYDEKDEPVLCTDGYAMFTQVYDDHGYVTEQTYYGVDHKPVVIWDGYATVRYKYDSAGHVIREAYYGTDNELAICSDGYAYVLLSYDEKGNNTEIAFYGTDDKLAMSSFGYARLTLVYDDKGEVIDGEILDEKGMPIEDY